MVGGDGAVAEGRSIYTYTNNTCVTNEKITTDSAISQECEHIIMIVESFQYRSQTLINQFK